MSKVVVKLNRAGVRELLRGEEMQQGLNGLAFSAQSRLGDGYGVQYFVGKNRAIAEVNATSPQAIRENSENNTILKALK